MDNTQEQQITVTQDKLTFKENLFCHYYATSGLAFGNATKAYGLAYEKNLGDKNQRLVANVEGSRMLAKPKIYNKCQELLNIKITIDIVDKELGKVILQDDDIRAKVAAIAEYNKVSGRITQRFKYEFEELSDETLRERASQAISGVLSAPQGVGEQGSGK